MSCGCTYTHSCLLSSATKTASCDCRDCGKYIAYYALFLFALHTLVAQKMIVKIWYHAVINFMVNFFSAVMLGNFPFNGLQTIIFVEYANDDIRIRVMHFPIMCGSVSFLWDS